MIEVELRSFVTPEEYERLFDFFKREGESLGTDEQETHYFEAPVDIRERPRKAVVVRLTCPLVFRCHI